MNREEKTQDFITLDEFREAFKSLSEDLKKELNKIGVQGDEQLKMSEKVVQDTYSEETVDKEKFEKKLITKQEPLDQLIQEVDRLKKEIVLIQERSDLDRFHLISQFRREIYRIENEVDREHLSSISSMLGVSTWRPFRDRRSVSSFKLTRPFSQSTIIPRSINSYDVRKIPHEPWDPPRWKSED